MNGPGHPEPSEDSRTGDRERLGRAAGLRGAGVRQRLVPRLGDGEAAIEPRDLEDLGDVLVRAHQRKGPAGGAQALDAAYEDAERGGVDEGGLGEVDHELLLAV